MHYLTNASIQNIESLMRVSPTTTLLAEMKSAHLNHHLTRASFEVFASKPAELFDGAHGQHQAITNRVLRR
jgi:hypothetical protein